MGGISQEYSVHQRLKTNSQTLLTRCVEESVKEMKRILILLAVLVVGTQASAKYINGFTFSKPWSAQIFDQDENVEDGYKIDLGLLESNSYNGIASLGISEYIFSDEIHKKIKIRAIHLPLYAPLPGENVLVLLGFNPTFNYSAEAELRDQQSEPTEDFKL